jgi:cytochrome P450
MTLSPRGPGPFDRLRRALEGHLEDHVSWGAHAPPSVLHRLANGCPAHRIRLSPESVRDGAVTLFVATVAGLSCSMKHSLYWILRTPGMAARIRAATARMVAEDDPAAIVTDPFLDAIAKEVLRLCPDIPFAVRRAASDVAIGPWRLPAGTTLGLGIHLIHRRASSFPQPERFWPERFLSARPSRFEYLPFGGCRRGCVAAAFFPFVQKLILAAVLERHHLRLRDRRINPVTSLAIVSTPFRPLWAMSEPRSPLRTIVHGGIPAVPAPGRHATGGPAPAVGRFASSRIAAEGRP